MINDHFCEFLLFIIIDRIIRSDFGFIQWFMQWFVNYHEFLNIFFQ